jgi:hypothetical protein
MYPVPDLHLWICFGSLVSDLSFLNLWIRIIDSDSVGTQFAASFVRMMVSSGLAGAHVQPCPRNKIELLAISSWLLAKPKAVWLKANSWGWKLA